MAAIVSLLVPHAPPSYFQNQLIRFTPLELEEARGPDPAGTAPSASVASNQSPRATSITAPRSGTPYRFAPEANRTCLGEAAFGTGKARPDYPKAT